MRWRGALSDRRERSSTALPPHRHGKPAALFRVTAPHDCPDCVCDSVLLCERNPRCIELFYDSKREGCCSACVCVCVRELIINRQWYLNPRTGFFVSDSGRVHRFGNTAKPGCFRSRCSTCDINPLMFYQTRWQPLNASSVPPHTLWSKKDLFLFFGRAACGHLRAVYIQ